MLNELSSHSLHLIDQKYFRDFTLAPLESTRSLSAIDTDRVMLVVCQCSPVAEAAVFAPFLVQDESRTQSFTAELWIQTCPHFETLAWPQFQTSCDLLHVKEGVLPNSTVTLLLSLSSCWLTPNQPSPWQRAVKFKNVLALFLPFGFLTPGYSTTSHCSAMCVSWINCWLIIYH